MAMASSSRLRSCSAVGVPSLLASSSRSGSRLPCPTSRPLDGMGTGTTQAQSMSRPGPGLPANDKSTLPSFMTPCDLVSKSEGHQRKEIEGERSHRRRQPGRGDTREMSGMDDFYVTIPYGLVVLGGGVAGYVKRGSAASLAAGAGFGGALLLAGALSVWSFARGRSNYLFATVLQIVCAAALTTVMGIRYMKTRKVMPSGIIAIISAFVLIFYVIKISNGGREVYFLASAE